MKQSKVKVGVIGCGHAGKLHIDYLTRNRYAILASICDLDEKQVRRLAEKFNVASYYTDASEMLRKEKLDAVHICTPPTFHSALAIMVMDANCHVLVEKPMTFELEEADKMVQKSKETGVKLSVIHNDLFRPVMQRVKEMVDGDEIGTVTSVSALWGISPAFWWYEDWWFKLPGGRFGENLPHILCVMLPFIEGINSVKAFAKQVKGVPKLEGVSQFPFDELQVILAAKNSLASISMSMNSPRSPLLYISGTKASLRVELSYVLDERITRLPVAGAISPKRRNALWLNYQVQIHTASVLNLVGRFRSRKTSNSDVIIFPKERGKRYLNSGIYQQIDAFLMSILEDKPPPVTSEEARELVRVSKEIWDAVEFSS